MFVAAFVIWSKGYDVVRSSFRVLARVRANGLGPSIFNF